MRARLKALTTITAVLVAVTAVFVAAAPRGPRRRRPASLTVGDRASRLLVRRGHTLVLLAGAVVVFAVGAVVLHGSAGATPSATPRLRLAASSRTTTSTTTAPVAAPAPVARAVIAVAPPPIAVTLAAYDPNALIWPAHGPIWSPFGRRGGEFHTGTDIGAPNHSVIVAAQAGTVIFAGWESGYGQEIRIDHGGGIVTVYAHDSIILVRVGQHVTQGQPIGNVGSTGRVTAPHLHFEVRVNGVPRDAMAWLSRAPR
jgi:murein DD-endopeptidase MepM/ murein hydrolase activator NlpD